MSQPNVRKTNRVLHNHTLCARILLLAIFLLWYWAAVLPDRILYGRSRRYMCSRALLLPVWVLRYCGTGVEFCGISSTTSSITTLIPISTTTSSTISTTTATTVGLYQCGPEVSCAIGLCCSPYGWCGSGTSFCGS